MAALLSLVQASRIHHDPDLVHRIPLRIRRRIDAVVARTFERTLTTHLDKPVVGTWMDDGDVNVEEGRDGMEKLRVRRNGEYFTS